MHAPKHLVREPGDPTFGPGRWRLGPQKGTQKGRPEMNGRGKSDRPVVPTKPSNKGGASAAPSAEGVEGRERPKGNPAEQNRSRAQSRSDLQSALDRVRQAAVRDIELQFTTLWHHVYDGVRLR